MNEGDRSTVADSLRVFFLPNVQAMKTELAPSEMFIVDIGSGMIGFEDSGVATGHTLSFCFLHLVLKDGTGIADFYKKPILTWQNISNHCRAIHDSLFLALYRPAAPHHICSM